MVVSDTETEGRAYQISSEHHVRNEIQVRNAANWSFYALQTEEERGESGFALPIEIDSSRDITFANFHSYRVISSYPAFSVGRQNIQLAGHPFPQLPLRQQQQGEF